MNLFISLMDDQKKKNLQEFKGRVITLITNNISYAHGWVLFQAQKRSYISWHMENSWVSLLTKGDIMVRDFKQDNCSLSHSAPKTITSTVKIMNPSCLRFHYLLHIFYSKLPEWQHFFSFYLLLWFFFYPCLIPINPEDNKIYLTIN